jgi:hypothetical protein
MKKPAYLPRDWKPVPGTVKRPGGPWWPYWLTNWRPLRSLLSLVVVGYLVGQSYVPGSSHRQCLYDSTRGTFSINVQAVRDCPLTINIKDGDEL